MSEKLKSGELVASDFPNSQAAFQRGSDDLVISNFGDSEQHSANFNAFWDLFFF